MASRTTPSGAAAGRTRSATRRRNAAATPPALPEPIADPEESAKAAGLRYATDAKPGLGRKRAGKAFSYRDREGTRIADRDTIGRIKALGIPPAWTDVWISPDPRGHIQATGRDAKGRKQYRYHPRWREVRDESKYGKLMAFGRALPAIRERVDADLKRPGLPREKVLATVVGLLEATLIRVGNEEYAKTNDSFGLTTMRDGHAEVDGATVRFLFRGKSGIEHEIDVRDRRLANIVKRCQDLDGQELFRFEDDAGESQTLDSGDVNAYLREITGEDFTAKDFRTWAGTVLAAKALQEFEAVDSDADAKQNVVAAIEAVAKRLGNTRAVCRKCYVHPAVVDAYLDGSLAESVRERADAELTAELSALPPEEVAVLVLLRQRLEDEAGGS